MTERDADFAYDYTTDENEKVENIAWSYGDSVRACTIYGDVVTFDTSYRSITYGLLLGMWFGMDNNGKAILFGCVLLQDESSISFAWALQRYWSFSFRGYFLARSLTAEFSQCLGILKSILRDKHVCKYSLSRLLLLPTLEIKEDGMQYMHIKTSMPIEEHARSVLTPYAPLMYFSMKNFVPAVWNTRNGRWIIPSEALQKMDGECLVIWIPEEEQIHCSCKEFDQSGILCRHSLRVLSVKNYFQLPEKYLPLRWRRHSLLPMDDQNAQSNSESVLKPFILFASTLLTESLVSKNVLLMFIENLQDFLIMSNYA
ncbi:hypothetical protein GH714_022814 [Hevea brasiliensis]|uniref:Protein FAR1-RELATED SEQUENCE n=1 Tax=Hevea brasiliensis TaxID=3981 RepID=A0A6A6KTU7_HEVBR|nr:hypothetical protein GH714_022814 [Hevea brasiliensis]